MLQPIETVPSSAAARQYVVDKPLALGLTDDGIANNPGVLEHLVRWFKDALKVRGIPLRQRQLLPQPVERDAPGQEVLRASDLEKSIQPASNGRGQCEIPAERDGNDVTRGEVLR